MTRRLPAARLAVALGTATLLLTLMVVAAASAGTAGPPGSPPPAGTYRLPLAGTADVVRPFEPPPVRWAAGHRGVDLSASLGAEVVSPVSGVVTYAGAVGGRAVVTVTDVEGHRSSVEPLVPAVDVGQLVPAGAHLGTLAVEGSHCAPGTCLHWGVRVGEEYVDPLSLLPGAGPVVLLPLGTDSQHITGATRGTGRPAPPRHRQPARHRRDVRVGQARSASTRRVRSRTIAAVCIWEMRDSVTPRTRPISASVMPS